MRNASSFLADMDHSVLQFADLRSRDPPADQRASLRWSEFLNVFVKETDIVFHYCSRPDQWEKLRGSEGFIIARNDEIIASYVCRMN